MFAQKGECKKMVEENEKLKEDLNEVKSQVLVAEYKRESDIQRQDRRAQEEIASLQQLVQGKILRKKMLKHMDLMDHNALCVCLYSFAETIEESSNAKSEIDRLRTEIEKIKIENSELRETVHSQQVRDFQFLIFRESICENFMRHISTFTKFKKSMRFKNYVYVVCGSNFRKELCQKSRKKPFC